MRPTTARALCGWVVCVACWVWATPCWPSSGPTISCATGRRSANHSAGEDAHQFEMSRPGKLVDRHDLLQAKSPIDQDARVTGEAGAMAGDADRAIEA